jgi:hypothetical protein
MVMLPRCLAPSEVADFAAAVARAAELAIEMQAEVRSAPVSAAPAFTSTLVIQESGQPLPPGAVRLQPSGGPVTADDSAVTRLDLADPTAK